MRFIDAILITTLLSLLLQFVACESFLRGLQVKPSKSAKNDFNTEHNSEYLNKENEKSMDAWSDESEQNLWELSGLYQGDIMVQKKLDRNGIIGPELRWTNSTVPFYIEEDHFTDSEVQVIMSALNEYHNKTCIRFRPYKNESDTHFVIFTGDQKGCWSSVGMREEGQVINLNTPNCVRKGIVMHEILHCLGFFHQQSAADRDDYVQIKWENIEDSHEHNFNKYNDSVVTDYGVSYDFQSIMHYSEKAFSKNGEKTIVPVSNDTSIKLGQRNQLTDKDVKKLNKMYEDSCNKKVEEHALLDRELNVDGIVNWFNSFS